uniref:Uncharacterized protein n=1 Tax=Rhizophora mucronata TaxID=61149 RepID=A0A2P2PNX3_RHIMU
MKPFSTKILSFYRAFLFYIFLLSSHGMLELVIRQIQVILKRKKDTFGSPRANSLILSCDHLNRKQFSRVQMITSNWTQNPFV